MTSQGRLQSMAARLIYYRQSPEKDILQYSPAKEECTQLTLRSTFGW